jgi:hypothetical protein
MQAHCYREECGEEKEKPLLLGSGRGVDERKQEVSRTSKTETHE